MPLIFLSYRRRDSQTVTRKIYEELVKEYGEKFVFLDEEGIAGAEDMRQKIRDTLNECSVVVPVIASDWLESIKASGISAGSWDEPRDWVWLEIEEALSHDEVSVLPLLIDNVQMPHWSILPPKLKKLAFKKGFKIASQAVGEDVRWLIKKRLNVLINGSALAVEQHLSQRDDYEPLRREHYRHEFYYCLESNNGKIDEAGKLYLNALKQYLLLSNRTTRKIHGSGIQAYRLYAAMVKQMIENSVQKEMLKDVESLNKLEDFMDRQPINYLRRLHANLRIPSWNALKIEREVLNEWKKNLIE
jgi:hypothetical protein